MAEDLENAKEPVIRDIPNLQEQTRAVYYHPDGSPTLPLPSGTYWTSYYMAKGFRLSPPNRRPLIRNQRKSVSRKPRKSKRKEKKHEFPE